VKFSAGTLKIEVMDPDWYDALRDNDKELLRKVGAATDGEVRRLSFGDKGSGRDTGRTG
jgi:hypothetical protein